MNISEKSLLASLPELKSTGKFWIAYSGGLDSHVLLSSLSKKLPSGSLRALHINHGLSPNADGWQDHCQRVCENLGISFEAHKVNIPQDTSASLENLAREARYAVFNACVGEDDYLLLAHHQDDQVETMLYRLMRGTGPRGLAGIPAQRNLRAGVNKAQLLRPLLGCSRDELEAYAKAEDLVWVEDESNQDTAFDRNFLRKDVLPLLKQRWPGFEKRWLRTAELCAEADQLQSLLGEQDLLQVQTGYPDRLNINALMNFEELRQWNILRVWFSNLQHEYALPMPGYSSLQKIMKEVLRAPDDASPLVSWSNNGKQVEIRRFAGELYVLQAVNLDDAMTPCCWKPWQVPELLLSSGTLRLEEVKSNGVDLSKIEELNISFRQGGEQAKPAGRKTRSLKKLFQDYAVAPWLRNRVPLIYVDSELIAVADFFICEDWQREEGKKLYRFNWENKGFSGSL